MYSNQFWKLILLVLYLFSCKQGSNNEVPIIKTESNNHFEWVEKNVHFFSSIKELGRQESITQKSNSKYTIISYYEGNCSMCYLQLMKWTKVMESLIEYDVSFKFILSGDNNTVLELNLEAVKFPLDLVYYDAKNEFINKYSFLTEHNYVSSSMLLDKENTILLIGNPTISESDKNKFIELLEN